MKRLPIFVFLVLLSSLLIGTVSATPFPPTSGIDDANFTHEILTGSAAYGQVINEPLKTWQMDVIPWPLWALLALLALLFLCLSILIPERAELTTALLGFGFSTVAWITAPVIGFGDVASYVVDGSLLVVQPVAVVYLSEWLGYLFLLVWIIAFLNLILALLNFFGVSATGKKLGNME